MDKESINKRFIEVVTYLLSNKIVESKGLLSDALKMKPSKFSEILNSRMNVGMDSVANICDKYNIDANWLLMGRGEMLKSKKKESLNVIPLVSHSDDTVTIPVVDISVAAGSGFSNPDYIEEVDSISLPATMIKRGNKYLCVRIKGQSMVPSILDGGYLVIRRLDCSEWEYIRDGYVYVATDREGKAYVKRLKNRLREHGFVVCMSDNPDKQYYPNFNIYEEDLHTIWYAEWYFSAKIPNIHEVYYYKQTELEEKIENLTIQFQEFQKALLVKN